jgi:small subunit ribosomal protein S6
MALTNVYECMVIFDSNRYAQDPNGVGHQVAELVQKLGGEVLVSRLWNEQKLAYPVDGHRKGTYWLTFLKIDSQKLTELTRALEINETVLRQLVLKVDPRLVDTLVEHAKGGGRLRTAEVTIPADDAEVEGEGEVEESLN